MSMALIRAWGCGLRTVSPQSIPVPAQVAGVLELAFDLGHAVDPAHRLADAAPDSGLGLHAATMAPFWASLPSFTTNFPSTSRCRTGPGAQNTRDATGSVSAPAKAIPSTLNR